MDSRLGYCISFPLSPNLDSSRGRNSVYQGDGSRSSFSRCVVPAATYFTPGTERVVEGS